MPTIFTGTRDTVFYSLTLYVSVRGKKRGESKQDEWIDTFAREKGRQVYS